jgi:DNA-binding response OmpR family regulator
MKKVLIVDDQSDIRKLMRLTLGQRFELHEAADASEAWELIRRQRPDAVILDVMMPGEMDGYQLCERIKRDAAFSSTFVALVTARGQAADRDRGKACGADDYFVKPFSPLDLMRRLDENLN